MFVSGSVIANMSEDTSDLADCKQEKRVQRKHQEVETKPKKEANRSDFDGAKVNM